MALGDPFPDTKISTGETFVLWNRRLTAHAQHIGLLPSIPKIHFMFMPMVSTPGKKN